MRYERSLNMLKEVVAFPWALLSCGAWMIIGFLRGQQGRYLGWEIRCLEAKRDRDRHMAENDPMDQSDQQLPQLQFTAVFEYLINVSGFELPFILVLLDANDRVVGNKIVQSGENHKVLSATDFVCSEGAEEELSYPMHIMVRDAHGNVAYGYLDDIDAQPKIQRVHVSEDE